MASSAPVTIPEDEFVKHCTDLMFDGVVAVALQQIESVFSGVGSNVMITVGDKEQLKRFFFRQLPRAVSDWMVGTGGDSFVVCNTDELVRIDIAGNVRWIKQRQETSALRLFAAMSDVCEFDPAPLADALLLNIAVFDKSASDVREFLQIYIAFMLENYRGDVKYAPALRFLDTSARLLQTKQAFSKAIDSTPFFQVALALLHGIATTKVGYFDGDQTIINRFSYHFEADFPYRAIMSLGNATDRLDALVQGIVTATEIDSVEGTRDIIRRIPNLIRVANLQRRIPEMVLLNHRLRVYAKELREPGSEFQLMIDEVVASKRKRGDASNTSVGSGDPDDEARDAAAKVPRTGNE